MLLWRKIFFKQQIFETMTNKKVILGMPKVLENLAPGVLE